ncbi:hypothetical protein [Alkalicoccobacillus porphyridii]|uniref:hypothetical protein n=1 Tax=Alkalicoccobacillus porphyridii TaxID=2597270 RepID=UPI00163DC03A|nr:hypothetical protein [Alkalicoccobacillus porphyridii]
MDNGKDPGLHELKEKIQFMKRDQRQYKAEAFIEIYEEYVEKLEKRVEELEN